MARADFLSGGSFMAMYTKRWLSIEEQADKLVSRGLSIGSRESAHALLRAVGYYRLTGYLHPFRLSEPFENDHGQSRIRVLNAYEPGTTLDHAEQIIDFDRQLRMLVMDGVERIEIALRMQVGYVLGRTSAFAHEDASTFTETFTAQRTDSETGASLPSLHADWLQRARDRRSKSDERFVAHFREKYDDQMPIWALTETLELGQLSTLYRGLNQQQAQEIAQAFGVPTKKLMTSWLASLNYVRNAAAHHARLFNRKLQNAPGRPQKGQVPLLDHLRDETTAKGVFGTYNALALIAYLLRSIEDEPDWCQRLVSLVQTFPVSHALSADSMGVPQDWATLDLWRAPD
jgi:abortive infection bacteriophage resistance protein